MTDNYKIPSLLHLILEQESDASTAEIAKELGDAFKQLSTLKLDANDIPDEAAKGIQQLAGQEGQLDEGWFQLGIGLVLSGPKIIAIFAKIVGWLNKIFGREKGRGQEFLEKLAHDAHHMYEDFFSRVGAYILNTKIEKPEDKFAPTDKAAVTLGKVIYAILVACALYGAVGAAAKMDGIWSSIEGAASLVKSSELKSLVGDVLKDIASKVKITPLIS